MWKFLSTIFLLSFPHEAEFENYNITDYFLKIIYEYCIVCTKLRKKNLFSFHQASFILFNRVFFLGGNFKLPRSVNHTHNFPKEFFPEFLPWYLWIVFRKLIINFLLLENYNEYSTPQLGTRKWLHPC